eukprot:3244781-Pleurochrysis_carterae.AAC.2
MIAHHASGAGGDDLGLLVCSCGSEAALSKLQRLETFECLRSAGREGDWCHYGGHDCPSRRRIL